MKRVLNQMNERRAKELRQFTIVNNKPKDNIDKVNLHNMLIMSATKDPDKKELFDIKKAGTQQTDILMTIIICSLIKGMGLLL